MLNRYSGHAIRIVSLAWPVLVAQLASIGMMVIDTLVVGQHDTTDLAAVAIGSSLYVSLMLGLSGVVQALGPIVAHHYGAGRENQIGESIRQGFWLAAFFALPGSLWLAHPEGVLALAGATPEVTARCVDYLGVLAWCLPASLLYRTFHAAGNALGQPRPLMVISLLQMSGHALLATCWVGGYAGFAAQGSTGAAMSQATLSWCVFLGGLVWLWRSAFWRPFGVLQQGSWPRWVAIREMLRLGVPMGISYLVEITAFTLIALFVARLGATVVGAHRIVANLSAVIYMVPLAVATATSALVAQAAGGGREPEARAYAWTGIAVAACAAVVVGVTAWWWRDSLVGLASHDAEVATLASALLVYIALYQLPDGIQTVAGFALRGYKVTLLPLGVHLFCFWGLGLGLGYWLAFESETPQGVAGFWQATVVSTVAASVCLGAVLLWVMARRAASAMIIEKG